MLKNDYGFENFTKLMELEERTQNLWEHMGLVDSTDYQYWRSTSGKFRRVEDGYDEIQAQARGGERNFAGRENARQESFDTAFFPLDGAIDAQDIQDLVNLDTEEEPEGAANRVRRMVARIQKSHAKLRQRAMYYAIKENKTYVPGFPNLEKDFSTVWGKARKQVPAATFDLTDPAKDPFAILESEGRRHIIEQAGDNADGYEILFACSSAMFDALIAHPKFVGSFEQYSSQQEPLRQRIAGDSNARVIKYRGVILLECLATSAQEGFADDKGYLMPLGLEMFSMAFSPADVPELANTVAEEAYLFLESTPRKQTVQSESSFVLVNSRPELIVEYTATLPA